MFRSLAALEDLIRQKNPRCQYGVQWESENSVRRLHIAAACCLCLRASRGSPLHGGQPAAAAPLPRPRIAGKCFAQAPTFRTQDQ